MDDFQKAWNEFFLTVCKEFKIDKLCKFLNDKLIK